jgi:hypothetical protein
MFRPVEQKHDKVLIIGGGESLEYFDFEQLNSFNGVIITVNNVIFHLPRCDYWITVDPMDKKLKPQRGMRDKVEGVYYYCAYPDLEKTPWDKEYYQTVEGVHYLERIVPEDDYKLQENKSKITTGDSVYGALGLAYHMEAKEIVMLGVDGYGYGHWYDKEEPYNGRFISDFKQKYLDKLPNIYKQSVCQFNKRGTRVTNGSEKSIINCFERMTPQEAYNLIK